MKKTIGTLRFLLLFTSVVIVWESCSSTRNSQPENAVLWGIVRNSENPELPAKVESSSGKIYFLTGQGESMIRGFYNGWLLQMRGQVIRSPEDDAPGEFKIEEILETKQPESTNR